MNPPEERMQTRQFLFATIGGVVAASLGLVPTGAVAFLLFVLSVVWPTTWRQPAGTALVLLAVSPLVAGPFPNAANRLAVLILTLVAIALVRLVVEARRSLAADG